MNLCWHTKKCIKPRSILHSINGHKICRLGSYFKPSVSDKTPEKPPKKVSSGSNEQEIN